MAVTTLAARPLVDGGAKGVATVTDVPLSFWGGVEPEAGRVIDKRHPLYGAVLAGRVLVLPAGRGSCSASGVLLESIANGTAPAGIIVSEIDPIIGLGAILGEELLGRTVPVFLVKAGERQRIPEGALVELRPGGEIRIGSGD